MAQTNDQAQTLTSFLLFSARPRDSIKQVSKRGPRPTPKSQSGERGVGHLAPLPPHPAAIPPSRHLFGSRPCTTHKVQAMYEPTQADTKASAQAQATNHAHNLANTSSARVSEIYSIANFYEAYRVGHHLC